MAKNKFIHLVISIFIIASFTACGGSGGSSADNNPPTTVNLTDGDINSNLNFAFTLGYIYSGKEQSLTNGRNIESRSSNYAGIASIKNLVTSEEQNITIYASIDNNTLEVQYQGSITLNPGDYLANLFLEKGDSQYVGSSDVFSVIDGEVSNVSVQLNPVVGGVTTSISLLGELPKLTFNFRQEDLVSFTNPILGVITDDNPLILYQIDRNTGFADNPIYLSEGDHNVSLHLYDADILKGKSREYPYILTVEAHEDYSLEIVPLSGDAIYNFDINESKLSLDLVIPEQVVLEAGSLENLSTIIQYRDLNDNKEQLVTLLPYSSDYLANIELFNVGYGDFAFRLLFNDIDKNESIGTCQVEEFLLTNVNQSISCDLTLHARGILIPSLLAKVDIDVVDENLTLIEGASIYANDELIGFTGTAAASQKGELKTFINLGTTTIKAVKGDKEGTLELDLGFTAVNDTIVIRSNSVQSDNNSSSENDSSESNSTGEDSSEINTANFNWGSNWNESNWN